MRCETQDVEDRIEAYAAGELSGEELTAFEAHLSVCASCRKSLQLTRALKSAVRGVAVPAMPPELTAALRAEAARLQAPGAWRLGLSALWSRRPAVYGLAAGFAAAAAVLAIRFSEPATVTLPLDVLLAAHGDYARAMPLAPEDEIVANMPRHLEGLQ